MMGISHAGKGDVALQPGGGYLPLQEAMDKEIKAI